MTKFIAVVLASMVEFFIMLLPGRRGDTVRARLYARLKPFAMVNVGGRSLRLVIPDRHSLYWVTHAPAAEPDTQAWIETFSADDVLFDLGANVGFYAVLAAAHGVKRVYAFEPNPFSYAAMVQNVFANRLEKVVVPLSVAMCDRTAMVNFALSSLEVGTVGNEIGPNGAYEVTALAFSLDDFIRLMGIEKVTHLKIDVDGLEPAILKGAPGLLANPQLMSVLVEINDGNDAQRAWMLDYLADFGFREVPPLVPGHGNNRFFRR